MIQAKACKEPLQTRKRKVIIFTSSERDGCFDTIVSDSKLKLCETIFLLFEDTKFVVLY